MKHYCPKCGHDTGEGALFCPHCGAKLTPVVETAPVKEAEQPVVEQTKPTPLEVKKEEPKVVEQPKVEEVKEEVKTEEVKTEVVETKPVENTSNTEGTNNEIPLTPTYRKHVMYATIYEFIMSGCFLILGLFMIFLPFFYYKGAPTNNFTIAILMFTGRTDDSMGLFINGMMFFCIAWMLIIGSLVTGITAIIDVINKRRYLNMYLKNSYNLSRKYTNYKKGKAIAYGITEGIAFAIMPFSFTVLYTIIKVIIDAAIGNAINSSAILGQFNFYMIALNIIVGIGFGVLCGLSAWNSAKLGRECISMCGLSCDDIKTR